MTFAAPIAFALAATAIPIVVFYILKLRLRRVPVSTNLFWRQIFDEKPPRSIWQYLRHLLSLLVQLLFVALLVLAVADPALPWQLLQARRIVTIIDNSASMRAADIRPSRFEAAIEAALGTVEGMRFRDEMAIILAGPEPEVVVGMSGHAPTLKRALRALTVSDNPTVLEPAIELGKQLIGEHPHGQVLVFSDGCALQPQAPAAHVWPGLQFVAFGTPEASNIGITRFQVRRSLIDPLGYEVLVSVKNASLLAVKGRLELELDGAPVDILPLDLPSDGTFTRSLEKTSLEGGVLVARLTEIAAADGVEAQKAEQENEPKELNALATDDQAWAVLPPREIQDVLIITPGNLFLQKVFEANPLVRATVKQEFPATWPSGGIIVVHRQIPEKLPNGNLFVVDPLNSCDAWQVGEPIANPIVTEQDTNSPLMTHVRLDNVLMPQAKKLTFADPPRALASSVGGEPVYAEAKRSAGKCLVLSVDINEGDLAFRTAFPIMVTNALNWFAGQSTELQESQSTGSIAQVAIPGQPSDREGDLLLQSPSGKSRRLAVQRGGGPKGSDSPNEPAESPAEHERRLSLPPADECGIWRIASSESGPSAPPLVQLAVNLANDAESDLRSTVVASENQPPVIRASWFTRPIWFYLAAAACLVIVVEWFLYQRRVIT
jgi:hypothetical protein